MKVLKERQEGKVCVARSMKSKKEQYPLQKSMDIFVDTENKQIRLYPENKSMKDIIVPDCEIQGVIGFFPFYECEILSLIVKGGVMLMSSTEEKTGE